MNFQKINITQGVGYKAMKTKTLKRLFVLTTLMMLPLLATAQTCPAAPVGDVKDPVFQLIANASDRFQIGATDSVSSTIRGAMVWDDTNSTIAVCDGTNWVTLGSGGGGANALDDLTDVTNDGDSQLFARGVADPTTMTQSVVIGQNAAVNATGSLTNSVFIGWEAGGRAVNPDGNMLGNTVMGARAGYGLSHNANDNTIIGYQAGQGVENGDENVLIGKLAGSNIVGGGRNIIIGSNTSALGPTVFDTLNIGNTIYGDTSETTVGIGVESPSSTLHVAGDVQIGNSSATCTGTTAGAMRYNGGNIEFCNGTAWGAMGGGGDNLGNHTATQNIQLGSYYLSGDGGDEGITVDSTGQVGIGTAFPSETLHIMGTIRAESNLPIMSLFDINGGVDLKRWDLRVENGGMLRIQSLDDAGSGGGHVIDFGRSSNNVTYAKFGNNTPALYVDVINDDVGIGTDSPSSTLHVTGDIQLGNSSATCTGTTSGAMRYNGGAIEFCNGTAWAALGVSGGGDNLGSHIAGQNIQLGSYYLSGDGGDEGIRIDASGNVGIGVAEPSSTLHVNGEIQIAGDSGTPCNADRAGSMRYITGSIQYCNGSAWGAMGGGASAINDLSDGASDGSSIFLGTGAGVNDDGTTNRNVGIGVNALTTVTSGGSNIAIGESAISAATTGSANVGIGYRALQDATSWQNVGVGNDALRELVAGSGNIGIGDGAGEHLTDGSTSFTVGTGNIFIGQNSEASADNDSNQIVIGADAESIGANSVVLGNDSIVTTALKGNVGIGTVSPTVELEVDGLIQSNRIRLNSIGVNNPEIYFTGGAATGHVSGLHKVAIIADADDSMADTGTVFAVATANGSLSSTDDAPGYEELLTFTKAGSLGIGTAGPQGKLHVTDRTGNEIYIESNVSNGADILMENHGFLNAEGFLYIGLDANGGSTAKLKVVNETTSDPGSATPLFEVDESGNVVASGTVTATGFINSSDKRLKDEIHTVMNPLEIIKKLRGVFYKWKDSGRESAGVIAQEVREVLPSAVHEREDGMLAVEYNQLIAPMIEAIKLQQEQIEALKAEVEELKQAQ